MKQKKLLARLKAFFDADERDRQNQKQDITNILKKLKSRELKLKQMLNDEEDDDKRNRLQQDIEIIYAQRKKGVEILQQSNEQNSTQQ